MSTKLDAKSSLLIEILSDEILQNVTVEETSDVTLMILPPTDYKILISCSELMSSVYKKLPSEHKSNFIVYPGPGALI